MPRGRIASHDIQHPHPPHSPRDVALVQELHDTEVGLSQLHARRQHRARVVGLVAGQEGKGLTQGIVHTGVNLQF